MSKASEVAPDHEDIEFFTNLSAMWGLECMAMVYDALIVYHELDPNDAEERRIITEKYSQYNPRFKRCRSSYREVYRKKRIHYLAGELDSVGSIKERLVDMHSKIQSRFGSADFNDLQGLYMELTRHLNIELPKLEIETELLKKEGNENASGTGESFIDKIRRAIPKKQLEEKVNKED